MKGYIKFLIKHKIHILLLIDEINNKKILIINYF